MMPWALALAYDPSLLPTPLSGVRGVALKSAGQQALQALPRVRDGLVRQRTAVVHRVRGL